VVFGKPWLQGWYTPLCYIATWGVRGWLQRSITFYRVTIKGECCRDGLASPMLVTLLNMAAHFIQNRFSESLQKIVGHWQYRQPLRKELMKFLIVPMVRVFFRH